MYYLSRLQTPRLLRTSILSPVSTSPQGAPQQQCLPQVWRSETVVQVFLDFWMEYTEDDQLSLHLSTSGSASMPRRVSIPSSVPFKSLRGTTVRNKNCNQLVLLKIFSTIHARIRAKS